ncbi:hypothetical protein [Streptomyces sp. NPDC059072]
MPLGPYVDLAARHAGLALATGAAGLPLPGVSHIVLVKPEL